MVKGYSQFDPEEVSRLHVDIFILQNKKIRTQYPFDADFRRTCVLLFLDYFYNPYWFPLLGKNYKMNTLNKVFKIQRELV